MIKRLRFVGMTGEPLAGLFYPPGPVDPGHGMRGSLLVAHCFPQKKSGRA